MLLGKVILLLSLHFLFVWTAPTKQDRTEGHSCTQPDCMTLCGRRLYDVVTNLCRMPRKRSPRPRRDYETELALTGRYARVTEICCHNGPCNSQQILKYCPNKRGGVTTTTPRPTTQSPVQEMQESSWFPYLIGILSWGLPKKQEKEIHYNPQTSHGTSRQMKLLHQSDQAMVIPIQKATERIDNFDSSSEMKVEEENGEKRSGESDEWERYNRPSFHLGNGPLEIIHGAEEPDDFLTIPHSSNSNDDVSGYTFIS